MKLPPLPTGGLFSGSVMVRADEAYSADQMRKYAAAAYRAGQEEMRERAAKVADEYEGGMEPGESIRLLTIDEGNK